MATVKSINPGTTPTNMDESEIRKALAFDANFEIMNLVPVVIDRVHDDDPAGALYPVIRGLMMRIADLTDLIFEAVITDEPITTPHEIAGDLGLASRDAHAAMIKEVSHG